MPELPARKAYIPVDFELLRDALHLPEDTTIIGVAVTKPGDRHVKVYVSHPDLKPVPNREPIPETVPTLIRGDDGSIYLEDWGEQQEDSDDA